MDDQTTFRLPPALSRALAHQARERGVSKSQLVREALERYLATPDPAQVKEQVAPYLGALELDRKRVAADPTARLIRARNWRR